MRLPPVPLVVAGLVAVMNARDDYDYDYDYPAKGYDTFNAPPPEPDMRDGFNPALVAKARRLAAIKAQSGKEAER